MFGAAAPLQTTRSPPSPRPRSPARWRMCGGLRVRSAVCPSCGTFHRDAPGVDLANRVTDDLREVVRLPPCELTDLFAATESVRDDDVRCRCLPHGWQQRTFAHSDRHIVVACVVPEGTGHYTAARVEDG